MFVYLHHDLTMISWRLVMEKMVII